MFANRAGWAFDLGKRARKEINLIDRLFQYSENRHHRSGALSGLVLNC